MDIPERYVRLCLRVARHSDGFIDAYIGPPDWEQSIAAEEPVDPKRLYGETQLLLDGLGDADIEADRRRWLRGQLEALACITARLSGQDISWTDEVERCLGIRPTRTDASVFEDVHRRLDAALPGSGALRDRYVAWDENNAVPRDKLIPGFERLKEVLGPRAHALAPMPAEESVTYELVASKPWIASAWYQGQHRSRVEVNADLPISIVLLVDLAAHQTPVRSRPLSVGMATEPTVRTLPGEEAPDLRALQRRGPLFVTHRQIQQVAPRHHANGRLIGGEQPPDRCRVLDLMLHCAFQSTDCWVA